MGCEGCLSEAYTHAVCASRMQNAGALSMDPLGGHRRARIEKDSRVEVEWKAQDGHRVRGGRCRSGRRCGFGSRPPARPTQIG